MFPSPSLVFEFVDLFVSYELVGRMDAQAIVAASSLSAFAVLLTFAVSARTIQISLLLPLHSTALSLTLLITRRFGMREQMQALRPFPHQMHIAAYFASLLIANLVQAIGTLIDARWVIDGGIMRGRLCTAQGASS